MFLIVGLGNPGLQYANNRHNAGFLALDYLLKSRDYKDITKTTFFGMVFKTSDIIFLKPQTYMNEVGKSVAQVASFFKIKACDTFVIYDDLDIKFGSLKFRIGGSDAGHNGLKSINTFIKNEYKKIKIGIGRPEYRAQVSSYVLSDFTQEQTKELDDEIFVNINNAISYIENKSFQDISSLYSL